MFDRSAIEKIQELTNLGTLATDTPTAIIPGGNSVTSLENYMKRPSAFKSKFKTHFIQEFIDYSKKNQGKNSVTYIDTDESTAVSIFDHGYVSEPEWGHHKAQLTLKNTPAYLRLLGNNEISLTQQQLVDFLTDWDEIIWFYDAAGTKIQNKEATNRIRRLTINKNGSVEHQQGDFKSAQSAMESVEVKSGQNDLPARFDLLTPPHDGFKEISFSCQLRAKLDSDKINLTYRIIALETKKLEIGQEFKQKIIDAMPQATIYLGTVTHR